MIKSKQNALLYLGFSFSIFEFTTTMLNNTVFTFEWIVSIFISSILSLIVMLVIFKAKKNSKVINWLIIVYSLNTIIRYIFRFSDYIDIKHGTNSLLSVAILSLFIIIYLFKFHKESFERIAPIILFVTFSMLLMALILNYNKIQPVNIYIQEKIVLLNVNIVKVYDWVIPLSFLYKEKEKSSVKCYCFLIVNGILLVSISLFRGMSIRGESLYSLSPLHSIFAISKGLTIQRFDYVFTMLLVICFFSVLLLNIALINKIKSSNDYINSKVIIYLAFIAFIINIFYNVFTNIYFVFVISILLIVKIIKERRKIKNEN